MGRNGVENHENEMAIIPQSIVASNLLRLTVDAHWDSFSLQATFTSLHYPCHWALVPLILPLLSACLRSFKLVGNITFFTILTGYPFVNITFLHA